MSLKKFLAQCGKDILTDTKRVGEELALLKKPAGEANAALDKLKGKWDAEDAAKMVKRKK